MTKKEKINHFLQNPSQQLLSYCTPIRRWAFFSTVIIGFITHLFLFVNTFLNHDWILNVVKEDFQWNVGQGRWLSNFFRELLSTHYSMGWVISLYSILFLSLTSVIVIVLFKVQHKNTAVLIGGLIITFPVVAASFSYLPFADGFFLAAFLGALAVLLTEKFKLGFLFGIPLIVIVMAIYQPYWSFVGMLSIFCVIFAVFNEKVSAIQLRWKVFRFFSLSFFGVIFYYISVILSLKIMGISLVSYQGASTFSIKNFSPDALFQSAGRAYREFWFTLTESISGGKVINTRLILIYLMIAMLAAAILYLFITKKIYKSVSRLIIFIAAILLPPIVTDFSAFISSGTYFHMLMKYSYVTLFIAAVVLFEKIGLEKDKPTIARLLIKIFPNIASGLLIFSFFLLSNLGYYNLQLRYEKNYALMSQIVERIQSCDGYYEGIPVAVTMDFKEVYMGMPDDLQLELYHMIGMNTQIFVYWNNFYEFSDKILGVQLKRTNLPYRIENSIEYSVMEYWPAKSSITVIDGVLVAKIYENNP